MQFLRRNWAFLAIALLLNGLVLTNALLHYPLIGYDGADHLRYLRVLATRLPAPADTKEFFSPPLPYYLPSQAYWQCLVRVLPDCDMLAAKSAQLFNVGLSLGITALFWLIGERLKPGDGTFKAILLGLLALLTVYYKTFSQVRGEPYVAFFITLLAYMVLRILQRLPRINALEALALGVTLGGCLLSRQWAALAFPALVVLFLLVVRKDARAGWRLFGAFAVAGILGLLLGGWHYLHLYQTYGSVTAFNMQSSGFSLANRRPAFYTTTGLTNAALFTSPVRPAFDDTLLPLFYSDTWGDYWGYFTFIREDMYGMAYNGAQIIPYLGRVNLVSLLPGLLFLAGLVWGGSRLMLAIRLKTPGPQTLFAAFLFAAILFSLAGYLWFLVSYPGDASEAASGNTNKATYMIQVFMLLPLLAGLFSERIRERKPVVFPWLAGALLLVFLHNLPLLVTRYIH